MDSVFSFLGSDWCESIFYTRMEDVGDRLLRTIFICLLLGFVSRLLRVLKLCLLMTLVFYPSRVCNLCWVNFLNILQISCSLHVRNKTF